MRKLYIIKGQDEGKSFELEGERILFGRSQKNDIQIIDKFVSGRHLEIVCGAHKYTITDLHSSNGTFVDGKQITPGIEFEVEEGAPIIVGSSVISLGKPASDEFQSHQDSISIVSPSPPSQDIEASVSDRSNELTNNIDLLFKVANIITQPLALNEMLEKILDYFISIFKRIDRGFIILTHIETNEISEVVSRLRDESKNSVMDYNINVFSQVIKDRQAVMIADIQDVSDSGFSDTLKMMKIGSVICIPLICRSQVYGVIYLDTIDKTHGFRENDLSLLTALSSPIALAIENLWLHSRELTRKNKSELEKT